MNQAPTPIFDSVVADFAARGIAYISIIGGVRPQIEIEEALYVKPDAGPLGFDADFPTQTLDPIVGFRHNSHNKVVSVLDGEPDTEASQTDSLPSPEVSA